MSVSSVGVGFTTFPTFLFRVRQSHVCLFMSVQFEGYSDHVVGLVYRCLSDQVAELEMENIFSTMLKQTKHS